MIIPILGALLPSLIGIAENAFSHKENSGSDKKDFVTGILENIYDKFLVGHIPDISGFDEKKVFLEVCSFAIDYLVNHMKKSGDAK